MESKGDLQLRALEELSQARSSQLLQAPASGRGRSSRFPSWVPWRRFTVLEGDHPGLCQGLPGDSMPRPQPLEERDAQAWRMGFQVLLIFFLPGSLV